MEDFKHENGIIRYLLVASTYSPAEELVRDSESHHIERFEIILKLHNYMKLPQIAHVGIFFQFEVEVKPQCVFHSMKQGHLSSKTI